MGVFSNQNKCFLLSTEDKMFKMMDKKRITQDKIILFAKGLLAHDLDTKMED